MSVSSSINSLSQGPNYSELSFTQLPVCTALFREIPKYELIPLRLTCKTWYKIINDTILVPRLTVIESAIWSRLITVEQSTPPSEELVNQILRQLSKQFDPFSMMQDYCLFYMPAIDTHYVTRILLDFFGNTSLTVDSPFENYFRSIAENTNPRWVLLGDFCILAANCRMGMTTTQSIIEQRAFSNWSDNDPKWREATLMELLMGNMLKHTLGKSKIGSINTQQMIFTTAEGNTYTPYRKLTNIVSLRTPIQEKYTYVRGHTPLGKPLSGWLTMELTAYRSQGHLKMYIGYMTPLRYSEV